MTSLHVICGLAPQPKILATPKKKPLPLGKPGEPNLTAEHSNNDLPSWTGDNLYFIHLISTIWFITIVTSNRSQSTMGGLKKSFAPFLKSRLHVEKLTRCSTNWLLILLWSSISVLPCSVARGGSSPPIGLKSLQNRTFLELLGPIFAQKMKTAPPKGFGCRSCEGVDVIWPEEPFEFPISARKSLWISVKTFFFSGSPVFGRKNCLNFRFRPKNPVYDF